MGKTEASERLDQALIELKASGVDHSGSANRVAADLKLSKGQLSRYRSGERIPSAKTMLLLRDRFGIEIEAWYRVVKRRSRRAA